jgi:hypothetical protein
MIGPIDGLATEKSPRMAGNGLGALFMSPKSHLLHYVAITCDSIFFPSQGCPSKLQHTSVPQHVGEQRREVPRLVGNKR